MITANDVEYGSQKLASLLKKRGLVESEEIDAVLADTSGFNMDLPFVLAKRGLISEAKIASEISAALHIPVLETLNIQHVVTNIPFFNRESMARFRALPVDVDYEGVLPNVKLAMSNPFNIYQLLALTGRATVSLCVAEASQIQQTIQALDSQPKINDSAQLILDILLESGTLSYQQIEWAKKAAAQNQFGKHLESTESKESASQEQE